MWTIHVRSRFAAASQEAEPPGASLWGLLWSGVTKASSLALLGASAACGALACGGVALLLFLLVTHIFTPAQRHLVKPLYFDFSQPHAVASVSLLSAEPYTTYVHDLHELRTLVRARQRANIAWPRGRRWTVQIGGHS